MAAMVVMEYLLLAAVVVAHPLVRLPLEQMAPVLWVALLQRVAVMVEMVALDRATDSLALTPVEEVVVQGGLV